MAISYKQLGLVNTKEMFAKAVKGGYAIPAFNFNNMEQLQAIIMAAAETKSPVILQVSAPMPTRPFCAIWPKAPWNMPKSLAGRTRRLCFTSTMATRSRPARAASTWASRR